MEKDAMKIQPKNMKFIYNLSEYDCYEKRLGVCIATNLIYPYKESLEQLNSKIFKPTPSDCREIYLQIKNKKRIPPVEITKYKCGHYEFMDGQHRVCVAQKCNLEIEAYIYESISICKECSR